MTSFLPSMLLVGAAGFGKLDYFMPVLTFAVLGILFEGLYRHCNCGENNLYSKGLPSPDLLIRTGGDLRVSNFLLWQIAYSEIWTTPVFWPDFTPDMLVEAIKAFQNRDRRYGGLSEL